MRSTDAAMTQAESQIN